MADDDVILNTPIAPLGKSVRCVDIGDGKARQAIKWDVGTSSAEKLVGYGSPLICAPFQLYDASGNLIQSTNPLPVSVVGGAAPIGFGQQYVATTSNGVLITPGAAWRLTALGIESQITSSLTPDNPSVFVGANPTTTPTSGSQLAFSSPSFGMSRTFYRELSSGIIDGGASDKLLITIGTIANGDVLWVYGTVYLR
jgi:hypothetical protein